MQEVLNTSGMVDLPPQNTYLVHGLHEGYVGKVPQTVGDYVKKGQVLTRLKHPYLIRLQRRLLEKRIELKQLEQDYERKKTLIQEEATSKLSLEKVEVQYQLAKAQFKGIQSELKAIGISPERLLETEQFQQSVAIVAPANGFVKTIAIHPGQLVQPNEELYEILDLSHKHIEIEVLAKDIQRVKVGQKVKVSIPATETVFWGSIYRLATSVDVASKTGHIHAHIDEDQAIEKDLLPGTYLQTQIYLQEKKVWSIPNAAFSFSDGKAYVFTKKGDGFEQVEVQTGMEDGSFTEILNYEHLVGQELAISGAYYLSAVE